MNDELAGLLGVNLSKAKEDAFTKGLLGAIFQAAALSGPQRSPVGTAQGLGQIGLAGMGAYESSMDKTLEQAIKGLQVKELVRKQKEAEQLRTLAPQLFQVQREPSPTTGAFDAGQGLDVMQGGTGAVQQPRITGVGVNRQLLPALAALGPTGMEYAKNLVDFERALAPKTSIQTIFDDKGREIKVRYNEESGEFTPIGGAKAEPFTQVDRGNVIELRRPSGELVGTLPKGVAPTAPSYTWTDAGVLNTRDGTISQPTDAKGNPIVLNPTAKASDAERVSAGFFGRMAGATSELKSPLTDAKGNPIVKPDGTLLTLEDAAQKPEILSSLAGGILPNWMGGEQVQNLLTSATRQRYEQAQRNWVTANLRKESGAVIGVDEMNQEIIKYFPRIGDSNAVIAQKARAREQAENAMRQNAGRALSVQQQRNVTVNY